MMRIESLAPLRMLAMSLVCAVSGACAGTAPNISTLRSGNALDSIEEPPRNPCETEGWVEAVPTAVVSRARQANLTATERRSGIALYRVTLGSTGAPIDLRSFLEPLRMPELLHAQLGQTDEEDRAYAQANRVRTAGFIGIGAGAALALGSVFAPRDLPEFGTGLSVGGIITGLAGAVTAIVGSLMAPSFLDDQSAAIRQRLFMSSTVTVEQVRAAVGRHNALVRAACDASNHGAVSP